MGQNETRNWTAGFSPSFHLPGFHLGYIFLTHNHVESRIIEYSPTDELGPLPRKRRTILKGIFWENHKVDLRNSRNEESLRGASRVSLGELITAFDPKENPKGPENQPFLRCLERSAVGKPGAADTRSTRLRRLLCFWESSLCHDWKGNNSDRERSPVRHQPCG